MTKVMAILLKLLPFFLPGRLSSEHLIAKMDLRSGVAEIIKTITALETTEFLSAPLFSHTKIKQNRPQENRPLFISRNYE